MILLHPARAGRIAVCLALAVWTVTVACTKSPPPPPPPAPPTPVPQPPQASDAPAPELRGGLSDRPKLYFLPLDASETEWIGDRDLTNRYASTVLVEPDEPGRSCNGVIIHPRVVLTAGHCMCAWREQGLTESTKRTVIDGSACATQAKVTAFRTTPIEGSDTPALTILDRAGAIRPHPDLEIHLNPRATVESSHADLAVIVLEKPIHADIAPSQLADTEPRTGEFLSVAGYGTEEGLVRLFGNRYFRSGKIRSPSTPPDDRIPYEPRGVHFNSSYRGGPCLLSNERGRLLVGIVGLGKEQEMSCTSISRYRTWLSACLQEVKAR